MCEKLFLMNKVIKYETLSSTNDFANELLIEKENEINNFTVIWALNQTKGKGQKGNKWVSDSGKNLTFSIIYYPKSKIIPLNQFLLNQTVSLGIIDTLKKILPSEKVTIKWPNDIYVINKKIAGILIENQIMGNYIKNSIIGIGLNINQISFSKELINATSLKLITNTDYELEDILRKICTSIEKRFLQLINNEIDMINSDYIKNLLYFDEIRQYFYKNELIFAKIIGINETGKLKIVDQNNNQIIASLKEIVFIH